MSTRRVLCGTAGWRRVAARGASQRRFRCAQPVSAFDAAGKPMPRPNGLGISVVRCGRLGSRGAGTLVRVPRLLSRMPRDLGLDAQRLALPGAAASSAGLRCADGTPSARRNPARCLTRW